MQILIKFCGNTEIEIRKQIFKFISETPKYFYKHLNEIMDDLMESIIQIHVKLNLKKLYNFPSLNF